MDNGFIRVTSEDNIAVVMFNRPDKLNALNMTMFKEIDCTLKQLKKMRSIRAVIITGSGTDFCSGIDVKTIMQSRLAVLKLLWKLNPGKPNLAQRVSVGWRHLSVPVIAALHGRCFGGGLQIALGADLRIAAPDTSLSIMEGKWGLIPDMGGTLALRENMALDQAMLLAMSAKTVKATEALQNKLITEIADYPLERAFAIARELANRSPDAVAAVKKLYHKSWVNNESAILRQETWLQVLTMLGANRSIAVKKALGQTCEYKPRCKWF